MGSDKVWTHYEQASGFSLKNLQNRQKGIPYLFSLAAICEEKKGSDSPENYKSLIFTYIFFFAQTVFIVCIFTFHTVGLTHFIQYFNEKFKNQFICCVNKPIKHLATRVSSRLLPGYSHNERGVSTSGCAALLLVHY